MNAAVLSLFCGSVLLGTAPGSRAGHPPDITRHPVPQVAMAGSSITLIGATSDVLATSFHWEKDGLPVPGATSPTLVLRHLQPADAGDYQLIVSNHRAVAGAPPVGESATRRARLDVITPVVAAGQLDQAFADATGPDFSARAVLALPDGGCLIAGEAATGRPLLRLTPAGRVDETFSPQGADGRIRCLAAQGSGFLVGGDFSFYAGRPAGRLIRLKPDGGVDPGFRPPVLTASVRALAVQHLAGEDRILAGLSAAPWLIRLGADGTPDPSFLTPPLNARVSALALQADGRILLGGRFFADAAWPYSRIARLRSDGAADTSGPFAFSPVPISTGGDEVFAIAEQANTRILIGGNFTQIAGSNRFHLARLLPNGSLDAAFAPAAGDPVTALAVQPDGAILVAGDFSRLAGVNQRSVARLTPGGLADPAWTGCGLDGKANALTLSGTHVFAAGDFSQPHTAVVKLALNPPPRRPVATAPPAAVPGTPATAGHPLLLTVPIAASADTTFTWSHPDLAPVLTTGPELFIPAASPAVAGNWSVTASNEAGTLTWEPLLVRLTAASPGLRPWLQTTAAPLPVSIPTFDRVALSFPVPALEVDDLRVRFDLQHTDVNDLVIDLIAPDGQRVSLLDLGRVRRGSGFEHTVFADDAPFVISEGAAPFRGSWRPAGAAGFSSLRRPHAAGVWRIIVDDTGADSSAGTVLRAALEFHSPAVLPAFTAALPAGTPGFQRLGSTGWLRHWNAPPGRTVLSEFSSNLILWQPAAVLGIRMEEDQSQLRRLALPDLAAGYFRSSAR